MKRESRSARMRRRLFLENLEDRRVLAAGLGPAGHGMMHNAGQPLDVSGDGEISAIDALMAINRLNDQAARRTGNPPADASAEEGEGTAPRREFVDVNGDGVVSPIDAMLVINHLNRGNRRPNEPPPAEPRAFDGSGNNVDNAEWGTAGQQFLRIVSTEYADGASEPAGDDRLSPREISNLVAAQSESIPNERGLSSLVWQWGQFLDHDIDLTLAADPAEPFPIDVPADDPQFDPTGTGTEVIPLNRSNFDPSTGDSADNPRQQINSITAFIDGSNVYGSDDDRALALRTLEGGKLKTSDGDLLPFNTDGLPNAGGTSDALFLAGDIRANEQVGLIAMHTIWVREHNRLADEIAARHPELSDEAIYQRARSIVIAEMQAITYNEFLPALLGRNAIGPYRGYDETVNPGISNLFATAAYRFGHSAINSTLLRLNDDGDEIENGNLSLAQSFFNPGAILEDGIDPILKGLASQRMQEIDTKVIDELRNFLFGPPGSGGLDLPSLNIQRGRDHGLPDYNQARVDLGLDPATSFADISSDPDVQQSLAAAYASVDDIDVWVGILAEDHVPGGSVGELARTVVVDQFQRLRAGDRYWYERVFSGEMLQRIRHTTLADVIERNTELTSVQEHAFFVRRNDSTPPVPPPPPVPLPPIGNPQDPPTRRQDGGPAPRPPRGDAPPVSAANGLADGAQTNGVASRPPNVRPNSTPPNASPSDPFAESADAFFTSLGES